MTSAPDGPPTAPGPDASTLDSGSDARPTDPIDDGLEAVEARLAALEVALRNRGVSVEICVVGGALIYLVFVGEPGTRRPSAMFAGRAVLEEAADEVADRMDLPPRWLAGTVRAWLGDADAPGAEFYRGGALTVLRPTPQYVLAMRCLELTWAADEDARAIERDIGYLLRYGGYTSAEAVVETLDPYLNPRQRPPDLEERLGALL